MSELDPEGELSRFILHYFHDQGGFLYYEEWKALDSQVAEGRTALLQTKWIARGYLYEDLEMGGYELTVAGHHELLRLTALRFGHSQEQSE